MVISISLSTSELAKIDELRIKSGETRSAFMVRRSKGPENEPSRKQLSAIVKRVRSAIMGAS